MKKEMASLKKEMANLKMEMASLEKIIHDQRQELDERQCVALDVRKHLKLFVQKTGDGV